MHRSPVGEELKPFKPYLVLVQQHIVARRPRGPLDAGVGIEEVVGELWVCDHCVHHCPCTDVSKGAY